MNSPRRPLRTHHQGSAAADTPRVRNLHRSRSVVARVGAQQPVLAVVEERPSEGHDRANGAASDLAQAVEHVAAHTVRPHAGYGISDYLAHVERLLAAHPGWSRGTAHLNVLDQTAPDIAGIVRGKILDPTLWPHTEEQFIDWLAHLLDSPVGQSMLAPVA